MKLEFDEYALEVAQRLWNLPAMPKPQLVSVLQSAITDAMEHAVQAARRAEPEKVEPVAWIPVSERLPKPWEEVRFYPEILSDPVIDRGVFDSEGRCWYSEYVAYSGVERIEYKGVTHWQPITAPQQEQK